MSSPLISCPQIGTHTLQRNDETRTLVVDNQVVQFTPTEYRLLLPLLQGQPVSDTELSQATFYRRVDSLVRQSLEKYIDNIRGKLEHLGLSVYGTKYGGRTVFKLDFPSTAPGEYFHKYIQVSDSSSGDSSGEMTIRIEVVPAHNNRSVWMYRWPSK